jgi:dihydroflavonol-4-reductase
LLEEASAIGAYKKSKIRAERIVRQLIGQGLPAIIVKPSTPVGPWDVRPTPTGRIIVETGSGRMPGFVDTGLNMADVDDVADGHLAALRRGRIGESYILGGQDVLLRDLLAVVARESGRPAPRMRIPRVLAYSVAALSEGRARVTGREPLATLDGVRMARHRMFFSSAKAERELGYAARPFQEGVRDSVRWFRQAGYLR